MNDIYRQVVEQYPGFFAVKNLDSRYLMINREAVSWYGVKSSASVVDNALLDAELPCKMAEFADNLVAEDQLIIHSGEPRKMLGLYCFSGETWRWCCGQKSPYYNEQGEIAGVICQAMDVSDVRLVDFASIMAAESPYYSKAEKRQASYFLVQRFSEQQLTPRQSECLFLLLRGMTAKQIAERLFVSVRTVDSHIDQIKLRLNCRSKSQLIEKALSLGLLQMIPESML